ncbi:MAG: hypothetical protein ACRDCW_15110 [Sarcina sp.]
MAVLFKDLIKPMYSIGKETFTIKFDDEHHNKKIDFKNAVIAYLTSIGIICEDNGETCGNFPLIKLDGKPYLLEKRFITESKNLSEVAILIER